MTTSIEEQIEAALFGHVRDLELDGIDNATQIAWPNDKFDRPDTGSYVRVQHLPNVNTRFLVKGSAPHLRQGILQLTVVARLNTGAEDALAVAGSIAEQCPADLELFGEDVKIKIQAAPSVLTPLRNDASWDVPVSIRYECFA